MRMFAIVGAFAALTCAWLAPAGAEDSVIATATAVEPPPALGGFIDINGAYDTRNLTTGTLAVLTTLPAGFQYFGFVNLINRQGGPGEEQNTFFSQQHLYFAPFRVLPLDIAALGEFMSGNDNDSARAGVRWRLSDTGFMRPAFEKARLYLSAGYFPVQFDRIQAPGWRSFASYAYNWQLWPGRVYVGGFADHYMSVQNGQMKTFTQDFVTEHQVGLRLLFGLHVVAEYRHDDFAPKKDGVGLGVQYLVNFNYQP